VSSRRFGVILCPVDFSIHSAAGLCAAGGIARAFGGRVVLLHAQRVEIPVYFTKSQARALKAQFRRSAQTAWRFANDFAAQHLPAQVGRTVLMLEEDPVEAVLRIARELHAGLVVLGTHGRTGLARIRLGSVTESVLRQVGIPALTLGPLVKPSTRLAQIHRILCPVNYTALARAAFDDAVILAEKTGAELILAHVTEHPGTHEGDGPLRSLSAWAWGGAVSRCAVKEVMLKGIAAGQIVNEARRCLADIIVQGAQPRSFAGTVLFGSTSELVIRKASCPVLSVIRSSPSPQRRGAA
jgi:nucleotide-binding universal stress UspA family protein